MAFNLGQAILWLKGDKSQLDDTLNQGERAVQGWAGRLNGVLTTAIGTGLADVGMQVVSGIAGGLQESLNVAGEFEAGMLSFKSVTGASVEQAGLSIDQFKEKFLQLGAETSFSAAQAQEAAIALAKGGVSVTDIMGGATAATLDLASAGELGLGQAADIVAKQLGVWSAKGVQAADVANLLAQAANASTVDVDELANGLANVSGTAATVGVEYGDLVQTMALLAPSFNSASTAGTGLNNFLVRLQPTTATATTAMQQLGLVTADGNNVFFDAQGNFLGMSNAAQQLQTATSGLSEAEKTLALQTIFGNDGMQAAVGLANAGSTGFVSMGQAMQTAGTAAEQAAQKNQGFNFALDSLKGSIETIQIIVGGMLLPILTTLINSALIPAANAVMSVATAFANSNNPLGTFIGMISQFSPVLGAMLTALLGLADGSTQMSGVWQANFSAMLPLVQGILTGIQAIILAVLGQVVAFWQANGSQILAFAQTTWQQIGQIVQTAMALIQATIIPILSAIASFIQAHGTEIQGVFTAVWGIIQSTITMVLGVIQGLLTAALAAMRGDWQGTWEGMQQALGAILTGIQGIVTNALDGILNLLNLALGGIVAAAGNIGNGMVTGIANAIRGAATTVVGALKGVVDGAINSVKAALGIHSPSTVTADMLGKPLVQGIALGITAAARSALDALSGVGDDLLKQLQDIHKKAEDMLEKFVRMSLKGTATLAAARRDATKELQRASTDAAQASADMDAQITKLKDEQKARQVQMDALITEMQSLHGSTNATDKARLAAIRQQLRDEYQAYDEANTKIENLQYQQRVMPAVNQRAQEQLAEANRQATEMATTDADKAAEWYALRKKQILDIAALEREAATATTDADQAAYAEQFRLLNEQQDAEQALFQRGRRDNFAGFDTMHSDIQKMLTDTKQSGVQDIFSALLNNLQGLTQASGNTYFEYNAPGSTLTRSDVEQLFRSLFEQYGKTAQARIRSS